MRTPLLVSLPLLAVGTGLVALPDEAPRLFSLSEDHGPSIVDGLGVGLVLLGWSLVVAAVWRRRRRVAARARAPMVAVSVASVLAGVALITWSVAGDHGAWWAIGIVLAVAPQLAAIHAAR